MTYINSKIRLFRFKIKRYKKERATTNIMTHLINSVETKSTQPTPPPS